MLLCDKGVAAGSLMVSLGGGGGGGGNHVSYRVYKNEMLNANFGRNIENVQKNI